jgi:hypothetical protein
MPWTVLPVELIVRILDALDPQALVNCRRVMFSLLCFRSLARFPDNNHNNLAMSPF